VLPPRDVSRVIGPLDELRMHDLKLGAAKKAKPLPPALRKALRRTGAWACPYCGNCVQHAGGCEAVVCDQDFTC